MTKLEALNKLKELDQYYHSLSEEELSTIDIINMMNHLDSLYNSTQRIKE